MPKLRLTSPKGIQQNPAPNNIKFTMSGIHSKIFRHVEKQKNITCNEEKY